MAVEMKNKKTTIAGFLILGAAVITCVATLLTGGDLGACLQNSLIPALTGSGLLAAGDGGL